MEGEVPRALARGTFTNPPEAYIFYYQKSQIGIYLIVLRIQFDLLSKVTNIKRSKGVFIWRRASPLGRASPSKRAGFHLAFTWEKPALLPGLACLAESPRLTTFIFPRNLESDICVQVFIL